MRPPDLRAVRACRVSADRPARSRGSGVRAGMRSPEVLLRGSHVRQATFIALRRLMQRLLHTALGAMCLILAIAAAPVRAQAQDITCDPGDKEVRSLVFRGNHAFSASDLEVRIATTESSWFRRHFGFFGARHCLDRTELPLDVLRLKKFYRDRGLLRHASGHARAGDGRRCRPRDLHDRRRAAHSHRLIGDQRSRVGAQSGRDRGWAPAARRDAVRRRGVGNGVGHDHGPPAEFGLPGRRVAAQLHAAIRCAEGECVDPRGAGSARAHRGHSRARAAGGQHASAADRRRRGAGAARHPVRRPLQRPEVDRRAAEPVSAGGVPARGGVARFSADGRGLAGDAAREFARRLHAAARHQVWVGDARLLPDERAVHEQELPASGPPPGSRRSTVEDRVRIPPGLVGDPGPLLPGRAPQGSVQR